MNRIFSKKSTHKYNQLVVISSRFNPFVDNEIIENAKKSLIL
jgi:hypothetical protein